MLSRQHRGLLLRDEGPHRSSLESHVTQAARLFRAGGRRKLTRALGGRKDSGDSLGFFLPHVTSDLESPATGNANGYKQKPPTKVALSGAGEPSKTSGQELPSSSKHPENLAPQPRLQSLPGSLDPHPPGGGRHLPLPPGWREGSQHFHPSRRPASLSPHRSQRTPASSQHEWGPSPSSLAGARGPRGVRTRTTTNLQPPSMEQSRAPPPCQPGGLSGGRVGVHPAAMGSAPLGCC